MICLSCARLNPVVRHLTILKGLMTQVLLQALDSAPI